MKKLIFLPVLFLVSTVTFCHAQSNEIELFKEVFQMEKKIVVAEFMQLSGVAEANFWPLYDAYEAERKAISQGRINLLKDYAEKYDQLTDEQASALVKQSLDTQKRSLALRKKYFKKMSKAVGAKTATSFYQLEDYIATAIRFEILDAIPFVNE